MNATTKPNPRKRPTPRATDKVTATAPVPAPAPKPTNTFKTGVRGMTLEFEVTDYVAPESKTQREKKENPYAEGLKVAAKLKTDQPDKQLTVKIPAADAKKHTTWVRVGANEMGFTARITIDKVNDDTVALSFKLVDKIERKRKPKDEAAAPAETPAA